MKVTREIQDSSEYAYSRQTRDPMSSPPVPGVQFYLIHKKERVPGVLDVGIQESFLISTEIDCTYDHKFFLGLEPSQL